MKVLILKAFILLVSNLAFAASLAFASTQEKIGCAIQGLEIRPDGGRSTLASKYVTVTSSHTAFIETIDLEREKYDLGIKYIQATKTGVNFLEMGIRPNGLGSSSMIFSLSLRDVSLYLEPRFLVKAPEQSIFSHFEISCRLASLARE